MALADHYISFRYKLILDGNNELDLKLLVGINTFLFHFHIKASYVLDQFKNLETQTVFSR